METRSSLIASLEASERERLTALLPEYKKGLLEDVLPFWIRHGIDREHGGFLTALDRDGTVLDTDKGLWQQGRAAWLFGKLFNVCEPREEWLTLCRHGVDFIDRFGTDPSDGRMWFHVTRDGRPIRKRRYAFTESFAAIAHGELARATESDEYGAKARANFMRFVEHVPEAKSTGVRPLQGLGVPMITIVTAQELRDSIGLDIAQDWIDRSIETIVRDFLKPEIRCVMESVGAEGERVDHFDGRLLNPGHAIEGAWFLMHEGMVRGDSSLVETGCTMLDWMWERGWDEEFGGIYYFRDVHGLPVQEYWQDMKFWWPHNEAVLATLYAYCLTGEKRYARMHTQVHEWAHEHFADPEHGEWFGYLHRDGSPSIRSKGNLWKGPFHLPRMQLYAWRLLQKVTS